MSPPILTQQSRDAKVAQHKFRMFLVAEEEIAGFDILVEDVTLVTIGQGCSTLKGYAAELVLVAIHAKLRQRATLQIFHQFVVTMFAVDIGFAEVVHPDNHLEAEIIDGLKNLLIDVEVGIINLQHISLPIMFHQEHLCLPRVIAQHTNQPIQDTFEDETFFLYILI